MPRASTRLGASLAFPCGLSVPNRLVKAAMTERLAGADGAPNARHVRLLRRLAAGGAGLMVTGNVMVDSRHLEAFGNVTLDTAHHPAPFEAWARAGADQGIPVVMQLNHPGRQALRVVDPEPVAPSAVALGSRRQFAVPRPMTEADIVQTIDRFAHAARFAARAGFGGVQIHAAHGYLLNQFLSRRTNRRTDAWGGALQRRARLLVEVVERVRAEVPAHFAVGVKLNAADYVADGLEPPEAFEIAGLLRDRGLDFIEVSGGTHEAAASFGLGRTPRGEGVGYFREFSARIREASRLPTILTGGMREAAAMESALRDGDCDLVGLARPLLLAPGLPHALLNGSCETVPGPRLGKPRGPLGAYAELCWYGEQLASIADDGHPAHSGNVLGALVRRLVADRWRAWQRKRFIGRRPIDDTPTLARKAAP